MDKLLLLRIKLELMWIQIKQFFTHTLFGKKTPLQQLHENDPYVYEDDDE